MDKGKPDLYSQSRICFSQIETIHHNNYFQGLGMVAEKDWPTVVSLVAKISLPVLESAAVQSDDEEEDDEEAILRVIDEAGSSDQAYMEYSTDGSFQYPTYDDYTTQDEEDDRHRRVSFSRHVARPDQETYSIRR
jgi:hypothetical protein